MRPLHNLKYPVSLLLFILFFITGCTVGPNYCPPCTTVPENFIEQKCGTPTSDEDLVHWWEDAFRDPLLNKLLEETLCCNFDLQIAMERVCQARANYWVQFTSILPEFVSDFQATRYRTSQSFAAQNLGGLIPHASPIQNFFQIGIDAIWQIDLFGKFRRSARSAYYAWEASVEDARGVKITVLSEVANIYIAIRYYQTKICLAKELIQFNQELFALSQERFKAGLANEQEVDENISALEANQAALNLLEIALKQNIYSLAVLLGRMPESIICDFCTTCPIPLASGKIPLGLPCDLLRRRPDIASAERTLAAQTELIGVAVADLFPTVSLIGSSSSFAANPLQGANVGFSTDKFSKLFNSASGIWGIGTLVTWPIFDFGKRCANVDIQKFITNQAYLTYEKTVITAIQEIETALVTYFKEEERLMHIGRQDEADRRNLSLIFDQFQAGLINYTQVLAAKEKWIASENSLADSRRSLASDFVAVYKTFGGDW